MENNQITILLVLLAGIIFLLLVPSIPYTASQFFFQNTDLNYTKVLNGDYNNEFLFFDGNTISSKDINFPNPDINLSYADATFVPYVGANKNVNLGLNDLNIGGNLRIDPTGTFDIKTVTGTPVVLGIYNPIPDDGLGGYNVVTYFTSSDSQITTSVGGLAFGGTIIGADDGENYWGVGDAYGINGFINVQGQSYTPYIQLAYLSSQVIGGSMVEALTGIYLSVLSSGVNSSISEAVGIKVAFNTSDSGAIENCYGLKFEDITAGSHSNYAWYSGLGKVHFGDDVEMGGSLTGVTDMTLVGTTHGAEKLANGTFTGNANGWSLGTGWNYNTNLVRKDATGTGTLTQALTNMTTPIIAGETYQLSFTISNKTINSSIKVGCGGVTIVNDFFNNGTYTYTFKALTSTALTFVPGPNARFYIDNISIKRFAGSGNNFFAGDTYVEKFIASQYDFQTQTKTESSPSTKMYMDNNGKLGLNTTTPTNILNVVGDINASGTSGLIYADKNISAGQFYKIGTTSGITKNITIMKSALTTCDLNFLGGILIASNC